MLRLLPREMNWRARNVPIYCLRSLATSATESPAPPLMLKLRSDMKMAMKAKDTNRLNVLRGILAETTNAAKTSSPFTTDIQLLGLLRKRAAASKAAAQEFADAKREDLSEKELSQAAIMDEYALGVETMDEGEITAAIQDVLGKLRTEGRTANMGSVLKELFLPSGPLAEKPVERAEAARLVKGLI